MVSLVSPQGYRPLSSQYLIVFPTKLYRSVLDPSQSGHSSDRDTFKAQVSRFMAQGDGRLRHSSNPCSIQIQFSSV